MNDSLSASRTESSAKRDGARSDPPGEPIGGVAESASSLEADRPDREDAVSEARGAAAGSETASGGSLRDWGESDGLLLNWILPLVLLAAGGLVIWLLGAVQPEQRTPADASRAGRLKALAPVRVTPIETLKEAGGKLRLRVDGTVVPYREVQIATEVAGEIDFKADICEAGSYVTEGTVLMRIDATDYELEVERFERQKEQAYEAIRELDQDMVNTRRLIEVAEEDVALQRREVKRLESLPEGFASQGELDRARRALVQAKQQRVTYENELRALQKRRASLEASERLAATQLRAAKVDLKRTEIRAPIDGVIVREDAEMNSFVARGNPIVTIEDTSKVEVSSSLRMDQLFWVTNQQTRTPRGPDAQTGYELPETPATIEYEVSGRDGVVYRWEGRLLGYDGIGLDPETRTVPVRILVDQPRRFRDETGQQRKTSGPTTLVRGMYVRVLLHVEPKSDLYVIPAGALKPGNRVWKFERDETMLETPAESTLTSSNQASSDGESGEKSGGPETGEGDAAAEGAFEPRGDEFDPDEWIPGRVSIVESVLPVDSLQVGRSEPTAAWGQTPEAARRWICEDRGERLSRNTLVVVSPIGSIDEEGIKARAERIPEPDPGNASAGEELSLTMGGAETEQ